MGAGRDSVYLLELMDEVACVANPHLARDLLHAKVRGFKKLLRAVQPQGPRELPKRHAGVNLENVG